MSVDLTPRQSELADSALRIVARDGMEALSFRAVAAEAGCSLGSVQKAFPSKQRMLSAAFLRLRQTAAPLPPGEPGRPQLKDWLVALLLGILPLDQARRDAQRQGDAFAQRAETDPDIATAITESDSQVRGLLASLVARARSEGEVPEGVDPDVTAWAVLALAQGLAAQLSSEPQLESEISKRLDATITTLLR